MDGKRDAGNRSSDRCGGYGKFCDRCGKSESHYLCIGGTGFKQHPNQDIESGRTVGQDKPRHKHGTRFYFPAEVYGFKRLGTGCVPRMDGVCISYQRDYGASLGVSHEYPCYVERKHRKRKDSCGGI